MDQTGRAILAIVSSIVGLSIVAVVLSRQAQTSNVIASAGAALANVIGAATSPVTGGGSAIGNSLGSVLAGLGGAPIAGGY